MLIEAEEVAEEYIYRVPFVKMEKVRCWERIRRNFLSRRQPQTTSNERYTSWPCYQLWFEQQKHCFKRQNRNDLAPLFSPSINWLIFLFALSYVRSCVHIFHSLLSSLHIGFRFQQLVADNERTYERNTLVNN